MLKNTTVNLLIAFAINSIIATAYYIENKNATYSMLSSDLQNIIPVAQKFDNPELFKNDLYLSNINNVKYYTPFYVHSLRFIAKFTNYNYVEALNVLGFFSHLLFGVLWFFLIFKFTNNFWVSLSVSLFLRGIIWLPGFEIWGISGIWTYMPRTLYIVLLPIPFLFLKVKFKNIILSAFCIGFIFNFHPISGLAGILLYLCIVVLLVYFYNFKELFSFKKALFLLLAIFVGMFPFLATYFLKVDNAVTYDLAIFNEAFNKRIPKFFSSPSMFMNKWLRISTLFFGIILLAYFFISFKNKENYKKAKILAICSLIILIVPIISVYLEQLINNIFNLNIRMSFQLIRIQKMAILPAYFALAFLICYLIKLNKKLKKLLPILVLVYGLTLITSKSQIFNSIPFVGDDLTRTILPNNLSIGNLKSDKKTDYDKMAFYISENTDTQSTLHSSHYFRGATKRSVVMDGKGASMIIEGNPKQFVNWYLNNQEYSNLRYDSEKISFLKNLKVNYIVTHKNLDSTLPIYTVNDLKLYKID